MRIAALTVATTLWADLALAHHELTPLREAVVDGHSHDVGGATLWLLGAAVAMLLAFWAVHKSVFRQR